MGTKVMRVAAFLCRRRGHDWFPAASAREFIPVMNICLRCGENRYVMPWGQCLGGHPMAEHYDVDSFGELVRFDRLPQCVSNGPA